MAEYTIVSNDDVVFVIDDKIVNMIGVVKQMFEVVSDRTEKIHLEIDGKTLDKCLKFCKMMIGNDMIYDEELFKDYFDISTSQMFELVSGANYLNIRELLDKGCKVIADLCKGKTVEELRKIFGVENDFTPEEEEKIKQECAWLYQ